ncbi:MAG: hypothetical protein QNJ54_36220 [Prochloraceae cyanobacterium]|nr:hypothetical protein [Prochloraceae cyanobacterium]
MPRKKLDRGVVNVRTAPETSDKLKEKAKAMGYIHGGEGATGQLLDAIAGERYELVPKEIWDKCITLMREISYNSKREDENNPHATNLKNKKEVK